MMRTWQRRGLVVLIATLLQACGGGGDNTPPNGKPSTDDTPIMVTQKASVQVTTYDASTGAILPNVTVTIGDVTGKTDANGLLTSLVGPGKGQVLNASIDGYGNALVRIDLQNGDVVARKLMMLRTGAQRTASIASNVVVTMAGSPARVELAANSVIDPSTNKLASGDVKVTLTPIDPAAQSATMPGSYLFTSTTGVRALESFGAVQVTLTDTLGKPLQLAEGKTATIRIPVKTRATALPTTIPLFYLDEKTGLWKEEGIATLKRDAASGDYYEGQVKHFSYWNADMPTETIIVHGCVRTGNNAVPGVPVSVSSEGLDYSGSDWGVVDAKGDFTVAMKKNGRAQIQALVSSEESPPVAAGPSASDITLAQCLVLKTPPTKPTLIEQPVATMPAEEGGSVLLAVLAQSDEPLLRYQWLRNGTPLNGQNLPRLLISQVGMADNGALYQVEVSTPKGGMVRSEGTILTVKSLQEVQFERAKVVMDVLEALPASLELIMSPDAITTDEDPAMLPPAQACAAGSVSQVRLDGAAVQGGEMLTPSALHTLAVNFANCEIEQNIYQGIASAAFRYDRGASDQDLTFKTTTTLTALSTSDSTLEGSGVFDATLVTTSDDNYSQSITPHNGASLRRLETDHVMSFTSGAVVISGNSAANTSTLSYQNVSFTLGGRRYVANGTINSGPQSQSGEVLLSVNGTVVARWRGGAIAELLAPIDPF